MKKTGTLIFLIYVLIGDSSAQISNAKFFLRFRDKNGSPYSLSNPSAFLSAKAMARRTTQNISYNSLDLPVNPQYITGVRGQGATAWNPSKWLNGVEISVPDSASYNAVMLLPYVLNITQVKAPVRTTGGGNKFEFIKRESLAWENQNKTARTGHGDQINSYNYGASYNQIHLMNGEYLHDLGYHGEGMVIAILDAGFYHANQLPGFDSLFADNQVLGTWDFVAQEASVYEDDSHGEMVLSCIACFVPDSLIGTAPKANFWLLRSEDAPTENIIEEYNWATAAEYADSAGADVITSSLGYTEFDSLVINGVTVVNPANHTYADMNGRTCPSSIAAATAASKGLLVLVAAGNQGGSAWHFISAPSDADSVLAVAAVDSDGYQANFSSWGPSSDGRVKPNVAAKGRNTTVQYWDGTISGGSGTSFATPVLAGSATCLWQAHPAMTNMQIYSAIERSANYHNAPNDSLGYGIPDFRLADQILSVIENNPKQEDVIVYPNPFVDDISFLYVSQKGQGNLSVQLFDAVGKLITNSNLQYDYRHAVTLQHTDRLAKGIYFLKITNGERTIVRKVVKD